MDTRTVQGVGQEVVDGSEREGNSKECKKGVTGCVVVSLR